MLLDEAYVQFAAPALRLDVQELIEDFPNIVVIRIVLEGLWLGGTVGVEDYGMLCSRHRPPGLGRPPHRWEPASSAWPP